MGDDFLGTRLRQVFTPKDESPKSLEKFTCEVIHGDGTMGTSLIFAPEIVKTGQTMAADMWALGCLANRILNPANDGLRDGDETVAPEFYGLPVDDPEIPRSMQWWTAAAEEAK